MAEAGQFHARGYAVLDGLLDAGALAFAKAGMDASERGGRMRHVAKIVPQGALNEYAPLAGEALLQRCRPTIEAMVGAGLSPAYAFWRIYGHGAELKRHRDRNACEVSATVPILAEPGDMPWPIHLVDLNGAEQAVALAPGQALIYQGCRVLHWRAAFPGKRQYQLFLHYVIAGGEKAAHAFDGRDRLAITPEG